MLNFNLLPQKQRRALGYEIDRRMVGVIFGWLIAAGVIFGVLLLPSYFFVTLEERNAERVKSLEEQANAVMHIGDIEKKVANANQLFGVILTEEGKRHTVYSFISDVRSRVPAGISISRIAYDAATGQAAVAGFAETRSALLNFTKALGGSAMVKSVSSPVANIIKESNIDFSLTLGTAL